MDIQPIKKKKLNDLVFDQMRRLIVEGNWETDERIPSENALASQFGVSRVTIRHALERLTAMGLIETRPGIGRYVKTLDAGQIVRNLAPGVLLSAASMREVNEFRCMLESWSAGRAAERAEPDDVKDLEQNYDAMQACAAQDDRRRAAALDLKFHARIGEMTRNSLVINTYTILHEMLHDSFLQIFERMGFVGMNYHRALIDAIAAHDSRAAETIATEHLQNNSHYF